MTMSASCLHHCGLVSASLLRPRDKSATTLKNYQRCKHWQAKSPSLAGMITPTASRQVYAFEQRESARGQDREPLCSGSQECQSRVEEGLTGNHLSRRALGLSVGAVGAAVFLPKHAFAESAPEAGRSGTGPSPLQSATQVPQLYDTEKRHVIITGGNTGIGKAAAMALAQQGMSVTLACRSEKGDVAAADIIRKTGNAQVRSMRCDLASLKSIREFALQYQRLGLPLHVLVNNAGVMACPQSTTEDGFERHLGVNHLGHFLLTGLLLPTLAASATPGQRSRIVVVSSKAETIGSLDFDDLMFQKSRQYNPWLAYGQSKLANVLFSAELARRCTAAGLPVTSNSLHPGIVDTELTRYILPQAVLEAREKDPQKSARFTKFLGLKTAEEGAETVVYLSSSQAVKGCTGLYYEDCKEQMPSTHARDAVTAGKLWAVSEELSNVNYTFNRTKEDSFLV